MAAFDTLPAPLRMLMAESLIDGAALPLKELLEDHPEIPIDLVFMVARARFAAAEAAAIARAAARYFDITGLPYPHVEAGATVMRWNERDLVLAQFQGC